MCSCHRPRWQEASVSLADQRYLRLQPGSDTHRSDPPADTSKAAHVTNIQAVANRHGVDRAFEGVKGMIPAYIVYLKRLCRSLKVVHRPYVSNVKPHTF
jgi:hypothetical protein